MGNALLVGVAALAYGVLFAPIVVIVVFAFNAPLGRFNLIWQGFTLENWLHPLRDAALSQAFATSLGLALTASALLAYWLLRLTLQAFPSG